MPPRFSLSGSGTDLVVVVVVAAAVVVVVVIVVVNWGDAIQKSIRHL